MPDTEACNSLHHKERSMMIVLYVDKRALCRTNLGQVNLKIYFRCDMFTLLPGGFGGWIKQAFYPPSIAGFNPQLYINVTASRRSFTVKTCKAFHSDALMSVCCLHVYVLVEEEEALWMRWHADTETKSSALCVTRGHCCFFPTTQSQITSNKYFILEKSRLLHINVTTFTNHRYNKKLSWG